jgi:hypothetical protein
MVIHKINIASIRRLHSTSMWKAAAVPMSRYEPNFYLPYEKLAANLSIVKKRFLMNKLLI